VTPAEVAGDADGTSAMVPEADRAPTGDPAVDEVLHRLDAVTGEPLDVQIEVAEQVHRVLQGRLADLGQE
jgi:hypothetical protein